MSWPTATAAAPAQRAPAVTGEHGQSPRIRYTTDHRVTVEGILWIARTGAPWRDLPERFGKWGTIYQRFNRWAKSGVFARIFELIAAGAPKEGARARASVPSTDTTNLADTF